MPGGLQPLVAPGSYQFVDVAVEDRIIVVDKQVAAAVIGAAGQLVDAAEYRGAASPIDCSVKPGPVAATAD